MAQPGRAPITCSVCNGWYGSESELHDHMQAVHRRFVPEQTACQHGDTQPDNFKNQLGTSKEEWAKLSVQLRNRVQVRFKQTPLTNLYCLPAKARSSKMCAECHD
jgi:hypothetical protein